MKKSLALSMVFAAGLAAPASAQNFSVSNNTPGIIPDCPLSSPTWNMDPDLQSKGSWLPFTSTVSVPTPVTGITHVILNGFNHDSLEQVHAYLTDPTGNNRYNFIVRPGWDFSTPGTGDFLPGTYDICRGGGPSLPCCGTSASPGKYLQYTSPPAGGWSSGTYPINNTKFGQITGPAGAWKLTIYDWKQGNSLLPPSQIGGWTLIGSSPVSSGAVSICSPGGGGIISCPCGNSPSGPGRGCNNSSNTGGATLSATGLASVSADSLVFTTSDERPTALSILIQGDEQLPAGVTFGDGVRCVGENLKRMYSKSAVGGSIIAPAGSEPSVSARSAALGAPIFPGSEKRYQVYYRDPDPIFACFVSPGGAKFNITVGLRVPWGL